MNQPRASGRLIAYMKPYTRQLIIAMTLLLLATAGSVVGPLIIKVFIDDYLTPRIFDWPSLALLGVGYLLLHIVSVVLSYLQLVRFHQIALHIIQQIRIDVFSKVQHLGLSFFDRTPAGSLVSRITNDTEAIKDLYVTVLSTFVQNIVLLMGIFIGMFYLDFQLGILCLILIPLIAVLMKTYRHFSSKVFHLSREKLSQLNAKLSESLQGMNIIQAMQQEKRFRQEFGRVNDQYYQADLRQVKLSGLLLRPAVDFLELLTLMLILGYFGFQSFESTVEIGVIYAFVNYLGRFFEPVNQMMFRLTHLQQAIVASERVFTLLDEKTMAPSQQGDIHPRIEEGSIEFKDVHFSYDGRTDVLKNISFTVKPGETVALVGHTGSGKSSIINLLMRFYPFEKGEIKMDGVPLQAYSDEELRSKVGLVLQDSFLFVGDIAHNIRLHNPSISDEHIKEASRFVQADSFIQKLPEKYQEAVGERGATFSSGQRQLLSFARTMAMQPKILVLDEATAAVDTETEEAIQVALEKMRKGRTTIAIAHRLSTIQNADLILVLHHGEIVERGTHQELLAQKGLYYKMYILQQGGETLTSTVVV
ncbi:ABC transporter ATP-binding protein [Ammoniphilus sp. CFH 90114]|uniref:ABC transporter ATP-binding protein n=1 Tax=Ammoniphilus sp. CFH 90114 TaxID=2493665 RepID=UPI00100FB23C|nr:ABC transporter transmembrane domain-containing protein [Ammoniphilus sp. CFH 90114]RXT04183.1 ATP-binding cassette domain-containing protein [Ammoniphilus sp. CFH 90114]